MVKVNGKEMVFSTWFTIKHDGSALIEAPGMSGQPWRFDIMPWTGNPNWSEHPMDVVERKNWEGEISIAAVGREMHVQMPFLSATETRLNDFTADVPTFGKLEGHIVRQRLAGGMLVHVALYLERTPNYAPKYP